jgi:hypothetical protein
MKIRNLQIRQQTKQMQQVLRKAAKTKHAIAAEDGTLES